MIIYIQVIETINAAASHGLTGVKSMSIKQHQGHVHTIQIIQNMYEPIIPKKMLMAFSTLVDIKSINIALRNKNDSMKFENFKVLNHLDSMDEGIWASIQQLTFKILCEEEKTTAIADLSGAQLSTFRSQSDVTEDLICSEFRTHMLQSYYCSYEMSLSKLRLTLEMGTSHDVSPAESLSNNSETVSSPFDDPLMNGNLPTTASSSEARSEALLPSNCCITLDVDVSDIFITPCLLKNHILEAHHLRNFTSSFSIKGLGNISGGIQVLT